MDLLHNSVSVTVHLVFPPVFGERETVEATDILEDDCLIVSAQ